MFERFTDRARRVVVLAQEESRLLGHNYIGTEHLLLGLTREPESVAGRVLSAMDVDLDRARVAVERRIGRGDAVSSSHIPFTPRAKKVLELSLREALMLGHNYIGTEHILLGLLREGEGVAAQVLLELGAELDAVRRSVVDMLGTLPAPASAPHDPDAPKEPTCPGCLRSLVDSLASKALVVAGETEPTSELAVLVVYCRACGRALGVLRA